MGRDVNGVAVLRNLVIPLRDGCRTAADVYLPADADRPLPEPRPAILERTPYDKGNETLVATARRFARRGYAVVVQDVRGRYASEGTWYKARNEGPDGYDTLAWLARQPWCDGRVATMGLSYSTCTQASLACLRPPNLAAQFLSEGVGSYFRAAARHGGALELRQVLYLMRQALTSREALAEPAVASALQDALAHAEEWLWAFPIRPGASPLRLVPSYEQYLLDLMTHGEFDDWWKTPGHSPMLYTAYYPDVPLFYLGGWFDHHVLTQGETVAALAPLKRAPLRFLVGPWLHGAAAVGATAAGEVEFGPEAALDYNDLRLRWFDAVLRGQPDNLLDGAPVRLFVMGSGDGHRTPEGRVFHGGYWLEARAWPPPGVDYRSLYLDGSGGLGPSPPAGGEPATTYCYDPANPVPSIGGNFGPSDALTPGGMFDQRGRPGRFLGCTDHLPLANRPDVLVFETPPLRRDTLVVGPVTVELFVSSDAPDTDFTAKLLDVYPPSREHPDGLALNLCDDVLRARYHDGFETANLFIPGRVYRMRIPLPPTANLFKRGHRIRLDISSSNFPRFDRNPNTGEPQGRHRTWRRARNSVHHAPGTPSRLILPVLDA